jgi:hypothetical protein
MSVRIAIWLLAAACVFWFFACVPVIPRPQRDAQETFNRVLENIQSHSDEYSDKTDAVPSQPSHSD